MRQSQASATPLRRRQTALASAPYVSWLDSLSADETAITAITAAELRYGVRRLKRMTLELGGKSAAIVLDDADASAVAEGIKYAALLVNGQACIAHTRILVPRSRHDEIVEAITAMAEA